MDAPASCSPNWSMSTVRSLTGSKRRTTTQMRAVSTGRGLLPWNPPQCR